jgi:hypothetical protein
LKVLELALLPIAKIMRQYYLIAYDSLIAHESYAQLLCSVMISSEKSLGVVGVSTADRPP